MSEYQYYEFVAIDRPLTPGQIAELRARSSRATITPSSFVNEYHWGDLKGDPTDWMGRYFDAFVYTANWGSCRFALRVPQPVFTASALGSFEAEGTLMIDRTSEHWIIEWALHESENYERFGSEDGGGGWMGRLVPLRDELLRGDQRALYLGWLAGVSAGGVDEASIEPEPPPGLSRLTAAQQALAEFLEIDPDLLAAATGSASSEAVEEDTNAEMEAWLAGIAIEEARPILKLLLQGHSPQAERTLKSLFLAWQRKHAPRVHSPRERRSVAELWKQAESVEEIRLQRLAEELALAKAEQRRRREAYLATLSTDFDRHWASAEQMAERGIASSYEQAMQILADLADAYRAHASRDEFDSLLRGFMERHGKRTALVRRLKNAGLWR